MSTIHRHGWALPLLLAASTASAQSVSSPFAIIAEQSRTAISIQGTGARAVGLGGAFIALADDASAVSFNPAGLAQLLSPEFSLVAESLQRDQSFSRFKSASQDFDDSSLKDTAFHPLFFSATIPFRPCCSAKEIPGWPRPSERALWSPPSPQPQPMPSAEVGAPKTASPPRTSATYSRA